MSRNQILVMVAVVGVVAGFGVVRLWPGKTGAPVTLQTSPTEVGAASSNRLPSLVPGGGSNISVVGGMSREEMVRRGILRAEPSPVLPMPAAGAVEPAAAPGTQTVSGPREGPPSALKFSPAVQAESTRYQCLCGCEHTLDICPCNDQPVGAVTMLTHLQTLLNAGRDKAGLDEAMSERYGPRVLVQPD